MRALCFALALALLALPACRSSAPPARDAFLGIPDRIPYIDIDRRLFHDVGPPLRTADGFLLALEACEGDTLMWFEAEGTGVFAQAFLRRGNSVYALGPSGDYLMASPSQSAIFSIFLEQWRAAFQAVRSQ